ncbi:MAG: hypothetical protein H0W34_11240 [Pyrinomonadaceae bacterium]|nr:hypothetical protein [Pyrinomonadaceae bacterium]
MHKQEGATFDRFGVQYMMKAGGAVTMIFDDVQFNGQTQDFSKDPEWTGAGDRITFEDREQVGVHDFGFSAKTNHAGGESVADCGAAVLSATTPTALVRSTWSSDWKRAAR